MISRIVLQNFKRFTSTEILCNDGKNIFIGENGAGKSTLLQAIGLVLSGSHSQIEKVSLASLMNSTAVSKFLAENGNFKQLPETFIELYFDENNPEIAANYKIEGVHNSKKKKAYGICLKITPNSDYRQEIQEILTGNAWNVFPYEFYKVEFLTFAGESYFSHSKPFKFLYSTVNTSLIDTNQETRKRIDEVYLSSINETNRAKVNNKYRESSLSFINALRDDNLIESVDSEFTLHFEESERTFRDTISAAKNGVDIKNLGQGEKVLLGVENSYKSLKDRVKILLIEEPENHLSYLNLQKLVNTLTEDTNVQVFIGTHSNMITSRLGVDNLIFVNEGQTSKVTDLSPDTVKFFKKSTNQNLLNFILSKKVILVEGNAEYILMEKFFEIIHSEDASNYGVAIISVDGLSFKRYLEIAKGFSDKKVAVITDNDGDYQSKVLDRYSEYYSYDNIKVFSDSIDTNRTFEVCLYNKNSDLIDSLGFALTVNIQEFMLREKAEFALRLLTKFNDNDSLQESFNIPDYIKEAIEWVKND